MSITATNAAWLLDISSTARKLVLLYLADKLNGKTGQLNPSVAAVARACGMSSRQAQRHIHDLIEEGLVQVTGNHNGGNPMATRHYRLNLAEAPSTGDADVRGDMDDRGDTDDADGCHTRHGGVTSMTQTGDTHVTQTGINQKEPEKNRKVVKAQSASISRPDSVSKSTWWDYLVIRKAKRAPITATAMKGNEREALKAGISLNDALAFCCEAGWQAFDAEWYANRKGSKRSSTRAEKFNPTAYINDSAYKTAWDTKEQEQEHGNVIDIEAQRVA